MQTDDPSFAYALKNLGDMIIHDYSLSCKRPNGRGCGGGSRKGMGNARVTADILAASHALRLRGHTITILDNGIAIRTVTFQQPALDDDAPPF